MIMVVVAVEVSYTNAQRPQGYYVPLGNKVRTRRAAAMRLQTKLHTYAKDNDSVACNDTPACSEQPRHGRLIYSCMKTSRVTYGERQRMNPLLMALVLLLVIR